MQIIETKVVLVNIVYALIVKNTIFITEFHNELRSCNPEDGHSPIKLFLAQKRILAEFSVTFAHRNCNCYICLQ